MEKGYSGVMVARRIVIVISSLGGGGTEHVVADLCRYLCEDARSVTLLTLSGDDPDFYNLHPKVKRERMEIRRPAHSKYQSVKFTLEQIVSIRRRIVSLNPDVVLSFIDQVNIRTTISLMGTGIPVIISERVHPGMYSIPKPWDVLRKVCYRFAAATVVQTDEIADWFRRSVVTRNLTVIPNAARGDDFRISQPQHSKRMILAVGRLTNQKGFDVLLRAFAQSGVWSLGWQVVILGEGPKREELTKLAFELGVSGYLAMPGHVANVPQWMSEASIFAFPSRFEGFPNALIEAMQTGLACVSTDCSSGPSLLIENWHNGILVPVDDVDALARTLLLLSQDDSLRQRLGNEAMDVHREFSPDRIHQLWAATLDSVV
jgi:glycosyltransferase involved in cell wall biosynthesis